MPISWTPFTESDTVSAISVNATFTLISDYANDLPVEAVERHGLRDVHLPSLFPSDLLPNGPEAWPNTVEPRETYENSIPDTAGTYPLLYQTISPTAGSVVAIGVYGPVAADKGGGWRILAEGNVIGDAAEVDFTGVSINLDTERLKGVLVRGSTYVHSATGVPTDRGQGDDVKYQKPSVLVSIGWQDGTGARHILERTIRWYSLRAIWRGEATTATLLRQADLDAQGDGNVANVFLAVANQIRAISGHVSQNDPEEVVEVTFGQYNVSVWPLHAGDLTEA